MYQIHHNLSKIEGFFCNKSGLFTIKNQNPDQRIGNYIELVGFTSIDGVSTLIFEFLDREDIMQSLVVNAGLLGDSLRFSKVLGDAGYQFDTHYKQKLFSYLSLVETDNKIHATKQIGWHEGNFVLPHQTIGDKSIKYYGGLDRDKFKAKGTLKEWQDNVARHCLGHPILELSLYAGFASILTSFVGFGFGIHLAGQSSNGKTTALKTACSIFGNPNLYVKKWNSTENGLEFHGYNSNHVLCPVDEINEVDKNSIDVIYMLVDGIGKSRAIAKTTGVEAAPNKRWLTLLFSTGEQTIEDMYAYFGKKMKAGEAIRMLDIPVKNICSKNINELLQENIAKYYGVAATAFIQYLIDNKIDVNARYKQIYSELVKKYATHSQAYRVLQHFALLILGGELPIAAGVLPEGFFPEKTCTKLFEDWLRQNEFKKEEQQITHGLEMVLSDKNNCFVDIEDTKSNKPNMIGVYKGEDYYLIPNLVNERIWRRNGINPNAAWDILEKKGMIQKLVAIRTAIGIRRYHKIIFNKEGNNDNESSSIS